MNDKGIDFSKMPDQAIGVITTPATFFRTMPRDGGFIDPMVFAIAMSLAAALIQIVLGLIGLGQAGMTTMAATGFFAIIMVPIFVLVGSFIGAAIAYVIWRFLGSDQNYETAFRCVAYMTAIMPLTALISAIPYLGTLIHVAWVFWLMIIASTEVHGIRYKTAQLVFGIIGAIIAIISISNEYATRHFRENFEQFSKQFGQDMENKSPEELGQAVGEFLKGLENANQKEQPE
ncbi:MAG: hypothetical protein DHS20C01_33660 [marine bacterium B5-7]|nr:MAG: hypothetical protein DHS20C01_33660 [marine bacterium B5-7]